MFVKVHAGDVLPVVGCRHCQGTWRYSWAEIWEFIPQDIRPRFEAYRAAASLKLGEVAAQAVS